jgi:hypothetical protein
MAFGRLGGLQLGRLGRGGNDGYPLPQNGVGVYNGNTLSVGTEFNTWLGGEARYQLIAFNQSSWAAFLSDVDWVLGLWPVGTRGMWSVPLACQFGTLPDVVAGTYDGHFIAAFNAILAKHPPGEPIPLRIGWEFNLLTQQQRAFDGAGVATPTVWVNAFRRIVSLARSISSRFKICWCPNLGPMTSSGLTVTDCWPGDQYVDFVSGDQYFIVAFDSVSDGGNGVYNSKKTATAGLDWLVSFAAAHGKRWGLWEWGIDSNDAPIYTKKLLEYFAANNAYLSGYWNNAGWKISDDSKPGVGSLIKKALGPPKVMNPDLGLISGAAASVQLVAQSEPFYPTTYSELSGADAASFSLSQTGLLSYGALSSGAKAISVRMTNQLWNVTRSLTPSFAAAYTFTNALAAAYVARMTVPPTEGVKASIDAFWTSCGAIIAKLDACNLRALHTDQAKRLNMALNPDGTTYTDSVELGTANTVLWPFIGNWTAQTGSARLGTQIAFNRSGNKFTRNAASLGVIRKNNMKKFGGIGLTNSVGINPRDDAGDARAVVNSFTGINAGAVADVGTLVAGNRSGASAMEMYIDGASVGSNTSASATPSVQSNTFQEGQQGSDFWGDHLIGFSFLGGHLTAGEHATLAAASKTLLAALSVNA